MKKILLTYTTIPTINIGDYVQSLAAKQYFMDDDYIFWDRDSLDSYKGNKAKMIFNAWFTYKPGNFPLSNNIEPLFISFHLNSSVKDVILSSEDNISYFKQYEPIGCRDFATMETFNNYGIKAYFSGCLTTTFSYSRKIYPANERKGIYIVDPLSYMPNGKSMKEILCTFLQFCNNFSQVLKIIKNYKKNNIFKLGINKIGIGRILLATKSYLLLKDLVDESILNSAIFITQYHTVDEYPCDEDRFNRASELLEKLSKAELVITSRIHAALPSLGLETPVLYINDISKNEKSTCRLGGIIDFFNVVPMHKGKVLPNEFGKISSGFTIKNKDIFLSYRDMLINKSVEFMRD